MKIRYLTALACAAALGLAGCGGDDDKDTATGGTTSGAGTTTTDGKAAPSDSETLKVTGRGYRYVAPEGWSGGKAPRPLDTSVARRDAKPNVPTSVSVAVAPATQKVELDQLRSILRRQTEQQGGEDVQDLPDRKVAGETAIVLGAKRDVAGTEVRQESVAVVHEGRIFAIALLGPSETFDSARQDFGTMLSSWRWR